MLMFLLRFETFTLDIDLSEQQHPLLPKDQCFADLRVNMNRLNARDARQAFANHALRARPNRSDGLGPT